MFCHCRPLAQITLVLAGVMAAPGPVAGQEEPRTVELSFSNPGARSIGLGGAFAALADDATAAFANPAGLVQLVKPEVSLELRLWSYDTPFTAGGRASGPPSGIGIDTGTGLQTGVSSDNLAGTSFLSIVYPARRWSFAFFRHQLANYETSAEIHGLFAVGPDGSDLRLDQRSSTDVEVASYGLAASWKISDSLSIGASATYHRGEVTLEEESFLAPESLYDQGSYSPESVTSRNLVRGASGDWGMSAGLLLHLSRTWNLAGFYRQGPRLLIDVETTVGPAGPPPEGMPTFGLSETPISLPDVYGLGLSYRSREDRLTLGFEWDRVGYSTIIRSLDPEVMISDRAVLANGDELHLGAEYVILSQPVVALRLGLWLDPDHRVALADDDPLWQAVYPGGDDELHYCFGLGLAFRRFQVDIGADLSRITDSASITAIYSF